MRNTYVYGKKINCFYKEIFEYISQKFNETFDRELKPISLHMDY